jgi:hypothetical protein
MNLLQTKKLRDAECIVFQGLRPGGLPDITIMDPAPKGLILTGVFYFKEHYNTHEVLFFRRQMCCEENQFCPVKEIRRRNCEQYTV